MPYGRNGWVKMKCCFHDDSHASAAVNIQENQFKCFACGVGGDTYDLIMEQEGMNFVKAVKFAEGISPTGGDILRSGRTSSRGIPRRKGSNTGRRSSLLDRRS